MCLVWIVNRAAGGGSTADDVKNGGRLRIRYYTTIQIIHTYSDSYLCWLWIHMLRCVCCNRIPPTTTNRLTTPLSPASISVRPVGWRSRRRRGQDAEQVKKYETATVAAGQGVHDDDSHPILSPVPTHVSNITRKPNCVGNICILNISYKCISMQCKLVGTYENSRNF